MRTAFFRQAVRRATAEGGTGQLKVQRATWREAKLRDVVPRIYADSGFTLHTEPYRIKNPFMAVPSPEHP